MTTLTVACFGTNGHQIISLVPQLARARLVGHAGIDEETIERARGESPAAFGDAAPYAGLDELLADSGARLVSICSPRRDGQHDDIARALEAGCHVYAEKPLATTVAGLDRIREAAARSGREVRAMTGFMYNPTIREIRRLVETGDLGEVVQVLAQKSYPYHDGRPQDEGVDGGLIMQAAIHAVSMVRYVSAQAFEDVSARETGTGNPGGGGLRMAAQISARLSGGALATIVANYCNPPKIGFWGNDQVRVFGTRGMAEAVDGLSRSTVALGEGPPRPLRPAEGDSGGYASLLQDYVDHILDGRDMLLSQEDSFADTETVIRAKADAAR